MPPPVYFKDLEFNLPKALREQLVELFAQMGQGALDQETVERDVPEAQGVYQLLLDDELVYIGKTDAEAGLRKRLVRHARKIRSRLNLEPSRVTFKAVRVYVFTAMDLETLLIKYYKDEGGIDLSWNLSGFGSNDPGRRRDETELKPGHFDKLYPINLDLQVDLEPNPDGLTAAQVLGQINEKVSYTIRSQNKGGKSRKPHPDLEAATVTLPQTDNTVRNLLRRVRAALGDSWQVTALPGYVIVYKESKRYPEGEVLEPLD